MGAGCAGPWGLGLSGRTPHHQADQSRRDQGQSGPETLEILWVSARRRNGARAAGGRSLPESGPDTPARVNLRRGRPGGGTGQSPPLLGTDMPGKRDTHGKSDLLGTIGLNQGS